MKLCWISIHYSFNVQSTRDPSRRFILTIYIGPNARIWHQNFTDVYNDGTAADVLNLVDFSHVRRLPCYRAAHFDKGDACRFSHREGDLADLKQSE